MGMCVFAMFQRCSSERSDWYSIDKGICSLFYGSGVRRLSGLSVLVWLCMYCQCFNAARLRGLTGLVLIWVNVQCSMGLFAKYLSGLSILVWLCMYCRCSVLLV